jgi:multidrug resistance efflux pump
MIKFLKYVLMISTGVALAFGLQLFTSQKTVQSTPIEPQQILANVEVSGAWAEGLGFIEPKSEVRRLTFKSSGVIVRCVHKSGDQVSCGEPIALLDDTATRLFLVTSKLSLELSRAKLNDLKVGTHPDLILLCEHSICRLKEQSRFLRFEENRLQQIKSSASDSEQREAATKANQAEIALKEKEAELQYLKNKVRSEQLAVAETEVRQAEGMVAEVEQRLADSRLLAPSDGTVLKYLKKEGEGVSPLMPPEPVVLFGDMTKLHARVEFDERHARSIKVGQLAEVYGRNLDGKVFNGRVVQVERVMGSKTLFSSSAIERKDLHVIQVVVQMEDDFVAPVGLQVNVRLKRE